MSILIRTGQLEWQRATLEGFADEQKLQDLLYKSPQLIQREHDKPLVFLREASLPGSGYSDLIGVDTEGNILLIETKLAKNPEQRRKVIGQIFEYAAYLWGKPYSYLDDLFKAREGKSLVELISHKAPELTPADFEKTVTQRLDAGQFDLLIVVDEMNAELEKIIAFLSSRSGGIRVEALALRMYAQGTTEVLVPQRYGQLNQPSVSAPSTPKLSLEEIIDRSADPNTRELMQLIAQTWKESGNDIEPGTAGISCRAAVNGSSEPIFWVDPGYGLTLLLDRSAKRGAPQSVVHRYRQALSRIRGFESQKCLTGLRPVVSLKGLAINDVTAFLNETANFVNEWRSASS